MDTGVAGTGYYSLQKTVSTTMAILEATITILEAALNRNRCINGQTAPSPYEQLQMLSKLIKMSKQTVAQNN